jgi:hypothetical protein
VLLVVLLVTVVVVERCHALCGVVERWHSTERGEGITPIEIEGKVFFLEL